MAILAGLLVAIVEVVSKSLSMACLFFVFDESRMPEELIK